MPELPEVETIARSLSTPTKKEFSILGRKIERVEIFWERSIETSSAAEFKKRCEGQIIQEVYRRGKYLGLTLSTDTLLFHLRMSGTLYLQAAAVYEIKKHVRLVFHLENELNLIFEDPRKFGRVWLLADPQQELGDLGPEPLSDALTVEHFFAMLKNTKRRLKPLLMDQTFLAGLGNIYTDEALFKAKLHPLTPADDLSYEQAEVLLQAIRETLEEGIQRNGASIDWVYRGGDFQNHFCVYGKEGKPCLVCGTPIRKIVVGQRGTHFCPHCQKEK